MPTLSPILINATDAHKLVGVSRSLLYRLIGRGLLPAHKIGGRTVIKADELRAYIASLPRAPISYGAPKPAAAKRAA